MRNLPSRSASRLGLAALLALVACQNYDFMYRPNQRVVVTSIREVVVRNADTDILFVVDNSGSMLEEQVNLIRNTGVFIEELALSENAYRVGVVTTNATDEDFSSTNPANWCMECLGTDGGRLRMRRATNAELTDPNPDFGLGVNLGLNIPCANTTRDPATAGKNYLIRPALDSPNLDAERCHLIKDFMATVASVGIDGTGREAGLLAAQRAVAPPRDEIRTHNGDFLRDDADLALIFLTDEEDCSFSDYCGPVGGQNACRWGNTLCYEEIALAMPVGSFVSAFATLKASTAGIRKVRAAVIAGGAFLQGGELGSFAAKGCRITAGQVSVDCGCWSSTSGTTADDFFCDYLADGYAHPCPNASGCTADACEALPGGRYFAFLRELGSQRRAVGFPRGTFEDSICQPSYSQTLLDIARTVVLSTCFTLEEAVLDAAQVRLELRHTDSLTGQVTSRVLPRFDPTDPLADCNACSDAACQTGAWRLASPTEICLDCGLKKDTGDDFALTVLNEVVGFDGGPP